MEINPPNHGPFIQSQVSGQDLKGDPTSSREVASKAEAVAQVAPPEELLELRGNSDFPSEKLGPQPLDGRKMS